MKVQIFISKVVYLPKCGVQKHWDLCYCHGQSLDDGHPFCLFH